MGWPGPVLLLTLACCMCALLGPGPAQAARTPHMVLMLVDEMGTGDVPWTDTDIHAPTILSLGTEGLRLGTSYAWQWCAPTRGALLSGRLPQHTGYDGGGMPGDGQNMPLDVPLLGEDLRRGGYKTHMLGKWHLGFRTNENLPINRGFDSYFGILGGGADHYTQVEEGTLCQDMNTTSKALPFRVDFFDGRGPAVALWDNTTYDAFQFAARAVSLVEEHDPAEPFFLYWAPHKVHSPIQAPAEFLAPYPPGPTGKCDSTPETCDGRGYGGCGCTEQCYCNRRVKRGLLSVVDAMLLNLTAALKARGMYDDTLIVFLGDNGAPNNDAGSNSIFKGMKFGQYEGGHRVPTVFGGGALPAFLRGRWHNGTTHLVDLHATLCDLAGVAPAEPSGVMPVDGFSLAGILNGSVPTGTQVRGELWMNNVALRVGDWKVISGAGAGRPQCMLGLGGRPVGTPHDPADLGNFCGGSTCHGNETGVDAELCRACRCPSLNLTAPDCKPCLYNLADDPAEFTNLATARPDKLAQLHQRLVELQATTVKPDWPPQNVSGSCAAMVRSGGFFVPWA